MFAWNQIVKNLNILWSCNNATTKVDARLKSNSKKLKHTLILYGAGGMCFKWCLKFLAKANTMHRALKNLPYLLVICIYHKTFLGVFQRPWKHSETFFLFMKIFATNHGCMEHFYVFTEAMKYFGWRRKSSSPHWTRLNDHSLPNWKMKERKGNQNQFLKLSYHNFRTLMGNLDIEFIPIPNFVVFINTSFSIEGIVNMKWANTWVKVFQP